MPRQKVTPGLRRGLPRERSPGPGWNPCSPRIVTRSAEHCPKPGGRGLPHPAPRSTSPRARGGGLRLPEPPPASSPPSPPSARSRPFSFCTTPPPHLFPTSVPESWVQPLPFSSIPGTPGAGSLHLLPPAQLPGYAPARPSVPAGLCSNARLQLTSPAHPQIHLPFHLLASHTCRHILSASWRLREGQGFVFCPLL